MVHNSVQVIIPERASENLPGFRCTPSTRRKIEELSESTGNPLGVIVNSLVEAGLKILPENVLLENNRDTKTAKAQH